MVKTTQLRAPIKAKCEHILSFPFHPPLNLEERDIQATHLELQTQTIVHFESQVAAYFAMPSALWFPSGTMAQGVALRIHADRANNYKVGLHPTSHLLLHEEDGYRHVHNLESVEMGQSSRALLATDIPKGVSSIVVELPQRHNGGMLPQWKEFLDIKQVAAERDIKLHLDGARLWTCRPHFENRSFADITHGVDSLYVSFYKDLGAQSGAMLLGDEAFIEQAKIWRARMGGNLVSFGSVINEAYQLFQTRQHKLDEYVLAAQTFVDGLPKFEQIWITPNPPHTNMFHIRMACSESVVLQLRDEMANTFSIWLADHVRPIVGQDGFSIEIVVGEHFLATPKDRLMKVLAHLDQRVAEVTQGNR